MKGRIPSTGFDTETSRLRNIDYEAVGRNAGELAKLTANPKKFGKSVELEVIFRPYALASLLEYITAPSLYGESAYKGESVYAGKLDELVASENLTIADNQVLPNGINSGIIDDEGIPARRVDLIKNGMLTSYLFDLYTGAEYGEQSTGNATRSERWASGKSYKSPPSVKAKNIVIEARRNDYKPMEKLQAEMEHGIIVHDILGAHTSNPASGDFSVSSTILFEVKRGEIISPLKTVMLSGNFHKLLNNITGFGNDFKRVAGGFSQVSAYVPSVRFEQVRVIG
jgi:PmbA protein